MKLRLRIKKYSTNHPDLDTLLNSAYTTGYLKAQKEFTRWDETDNLKRAKDSDILAEEKKKGPGIGGPILAGASGALTGAATGAVTGGVLSGIKNKGISGLGKGIKRGGAAGAILGGTVMAAGALKKRNKERDDIQFYNKRLGYAQRQALRREKKDWKQNMTGREGYSY